ncbi:MAG: hypothetical protein JXR76_23650 [Deltaproteobacteria bacterium]|nr:hypothetical protein [Deltaproteobacteria bacterium]
MKKTTLMLLVLLPLLVSGWCVNAQTGEMYADAETTVAPPVDANPGIKSKNIIGAQLLLGGAGVAEDWGDTADFVNDDELRARFAGGLGFFFRRSLTSLISLNVGLELLGKGYKAEYTQGNGDNAVDIVEKARLRYLEIPLGARVNLHNFSFGLDLVACIALMGEYKRETDDLVVEVHFTDADWDNIQRFNIAPRLSAGYVIAVGQVNLVPGLMWEFDLLNNTKGDLADADVKLRFINLMLTVGVEYGL